jgi:5-formyltetrahydrofolate cyclo-ligase
MDDPKKACRALARARRAALDAQDRAAASRAIAIRLSHRPEATAAKVILAYAAVRDEVDTQFILSLALAAGKVVALPHADWGRHRLHPVRLRDPENLLPTRSGIPEPPPPHEPVALEDIDLVLLPGLAFDAYGHRLGYGGGFYDSLLARLPARALCWGLAFDAQILPEVPVGAHDHPVHAILTESRFLEVTRDGR